jgi:hypothetical protein
MDDGRIILDRARHANDESLPDVDDGIRNTAGN